MTAGTAERSRERTTPHGSVAQLLLHVFLGCPAPFIAAAICRTPPLLGTWACWHLQVTVPSSMCHLLVFRHPFYTDRLLWSSPDITPSGRCIRICTTCYYYMVNIWTTAHPIPYHEMNICLSIKMQLARWWWWWWWWHHDDIRMLKSLIDLNENGKVEPPCWMNIGSDRHIWDFFLACEDREKVAICKQMPSPWIF